MKNRQLTGISFLWMLCVCLLMAGCRKDLCYHHDEHSLGVKIQAAFTWEQAWERPYDYQWPMQWPSAWKDTYDSFRPAPGKGVRSMAYGADGSYTEGNLQPTEGRVPMKEGVSNLLFYNNDTEYIVFSGLGSVPSAHATTRTVNRNGFMSLHKGERTMNAPDMLYGHYEVDYFAERTLEPVNFPVKMKPLVYTYYIRYEFKSGQQHVVLVRGALAGMAESVFLQDGHTGDAASTILFEGEPADFGAKAAVKTFGVPNFPGDHYTRGDGSLSKFALNLEVRLKNGKFMNFEFDVTDQLLSQPRGGVIVVKGIEVTEEDAKEEAGGGFDVEVEGWGDRIDIPLPL